MKDSKLSIVVPVYFEQDVVEECYKRLTGVMKDNKLDYEIIFVNDGSTDRTLEILECIALYDKNVKVISFSRNFGHQPAITAGMNRSSGDAVVVIDADLQDPPELIPQMVKLWENGYDVVYAKRLKRKGESWFKLSTAKMFYKLLDSMSCTRIPMDTGDFRLIDRKVIETLKNMPEHNRFVRGMVSWAGFKQTPFFYEREERFAGETKYPISKMLKFALDGLLSFSVKPVKYIESLGLLLLAVSICLFAFVIKSVMLNPRQYVTGWVLNFALITLVGGIQVFSIGVLGEYITRIYDESRARPLYVIDKEINMEKEKKAGLIGHEEVC